MSHSDGHPLTEDEVPTNQTHTQTQNNISLPNFNSLLPTVDIVRLSEIVEQEAAKGELDKFSDYQPFHKYRYHVRIHNVLKTEDITELNAATQTKSLSNSVAKIIYKKDYTTLLTDESSVVKFVLGRYSAEIFGMHRLIIKASRPFNEPIKAAIIGCVTSPPNFEKHNRNHLTFYYDQPIQREERDIGLQDNFNVSVRTSSPKTMLAPMQVEAPCAPSKLHTRPDNLPTSPYATPTRKVDQPQIIGNLVDHFMKEIFPESPTNKTSPSTEIATTTNKTTKPNTTKPAPNGSIHDYLTTTQTKPTAPHPSKPLGSLKVKPSPALNKPPGKPPGKPPAELGKQPDPPNKPTTDPNTKKETQATTIKAPVHRLASMNSNAYTTNKSSIPPDTLSLIEMAKGYVSKC